MGILDALFGDKKIGGQIAYFKLEDWWLNEFNDTERKRIQDCYQPMGSSDSDLTEAETAYSSASVVQFLGGMSSWFTKEEDRHLARKIIQEAESLVNDEIDILDVHFLYQAKIEIFYRDREDSSKLETAIRACQQQIDLAPKAARAFKREYDGGLPTHKGFEQLAIILEKRKNFAEAIALCEKALAQGWTGDWEKRIQRYKRKADKS